MTVTAPARLHLGLLDLEGGLGRRFGSLGLTLDTPVTRVTARWGGKHHHASGPEAERARTHLERLDGRLGLPRPITLQVEAAVPAHAGLGSGTVLALAVGRAVSDLAGDPLPAREVAMLLDRGARSGIGVGAFEQGGVLLDGGRGSLDAPPPLLSRLAFPEDWRILLITDSARPGIHGMHEREAFAALPPFPAEKAAELCRLMLMKALPGVAEADLASFGQAVTELQRITGDHFASAQGGRYYSARVGEVLAWLEAEGVAGFGQSSWGPTGFGLLGSQAEAEALAAAASRRWSAETGLGFQVLEGRNRGAEVALEGVETKGSPASFAGSLAS